MELTLAAEYQETRLALIHVPIEYYSFFLQPLLRLLFGEDHDEDAAKITWTNRHDFLNISITPTECSVICSRDLADRFFRPLADLFDSLGDNGKSSKRRDRIEISEDDYTLIQVDGQGLDAGQRVLELTSPLAMAGISIFFLTTYFSDYILVPAHARRTVTEALKQRGFVFSQSADAFVSQLSPSSPIVPQHSRQQPSSPSFDTPSPTTPPARDISELQTRTFARLKKNKISPTVDKHIKLFNCAGSKEFDPSREAQLKDDLLQVLISTCPGSASNPTKPVNTGLGLNVDTLQGALPDHSTRFLSLTLTSTEPISIFLESSLVDSLGSSLLGARNDQDLLIPITLDLRELPMEATGIVCGVAGRLAQGTVLAEEAAAIAEGGSSWSTSDHGAIEISFLSTARAGTVIVKASELKRAVKALEEIVEVVQVGE